VDGKASLKGVWLSHVNHLNFGGTTISLERVGRVEEMVFTARCSYASTVLGVIILSVCHTRAL